MRRAMVVLAVLWACGGQKKPANEVSAGGGGDDASASGAAAAPGSAAASASAPEPASGSGSAATNPPPTGGAVLVGDIVAPKGFDPKATLEGMKDAMIACYNKSRAADPKLAGKLTLKITIGEGGAVQAVEANPGGHANTPDLVACLGDAMRAVRFPKPGGTAIVTAPLVFHP